MASVHDLSVQSGFVFEGNIEKLGASTASSFTATPQSAVVKITRILKSTPALAAYTGQEVTVELKAPVTLKVGASATFFTDGMHFGDGLVVEEVGNTPAGDAVTSAANLTAVNTATDTVQNAALSDRLAQSDLVITGTAVQVAPLVSSMTPTHVSEHDPDWWQATIQVETTEKGQSPGATKTIAFAHSMDIAWHASPKIKQGDTGAFLLQNRDTAGRAVPLPAVVHPLDFQPTASVARVRTLLKTPE